MIEVVHEDSSGMRFTWQPPRAAQEALLSLDADDRDEVLELVEQLVTRFFTTLTGALLSGELAAPALETLDRLVVGFAQTQLDRLASKGRYLPTPPELSREQNPELYDAISRAAEDASGEPFRLPDFRDHPGRHGDEQEN